MAVDESGRWLLKVGWLWQFLKIRQQWSLLHWLTLLFTNYFSVAYSDGILPTELLPELESITSNSATGLSNKLMGYSESFVVISSICTEIDSSSRSHFLCNSSSVKVVLWDRAVQSHFQAPLVFLVLFLFYHICSDFLHSSFEPLKVCEGWIQLLWMLIFWLF